MRTCRCCTEAGCSKGEDEAVSLFRRLLCRINWHSWDFAPLTPAILHGEDCGDIPIRCKHCGAYFIALDG